MNSRDALHDYKKGGGRIGLDESDVDEAFNIVRRNDGWWEVFFSERGRRITVCLFESRRDAYDLVYLRLAQAGYLPKELLFKDCFLERSNIPAD